MLRWGAAAAIALLLVGPVAVQAHHDPTLACRDLVESCSRDIPRCGHLLDVVQQECRVWRSECKRTGNGGCDDLAVRCGEIWHQLRAMCEPRIDECRERMSLCEAS